MDIYFISIFRKMDKSNERRQKKKDEAIKAFSKLSGCPTNFITRVDTLSDVRKRAGLKEEFSSECYL